MTAHPSWETCSVSSNGSDPSFNHNEGQTDKHWVRFTWRFVTSPYTYLTDTLKCYYFSSVHGLFCTLFTCEHNYHSITGVRERASCPLFY